MKKRLYNYDLLRAISIFSVVLLHIGGVYLKEEYQAYVSASDYSIGLFFSLMTRTCVPCFVMISGAFMIDEKNSEFSSFYRKMWKKIIVPTLIFSMVYVLYSYAQIFLVRLLNISVSEEMKDLSKPLLQLLQGRPNAIMWYMYMLIGIYMLVPIIVIIKKHISESNFYRLSIYIFIYSILVHYTCELSWLVWFVEWLGYFILGYTIKNKCLKNVASHKGFIFILCAMMLLFINYGLTLNNMIAEGHSTDWFSPLIVASSLCMFIGFSMVEFKKEIPVISIIGKNTLVIYLIHILFIDPIFQILGRVIKWLPNALFILPYGVVVVFLSLSCKYIGDIILKTKNID